LLYIFRFDFYGADFLTYEGVREEDLWRRSFEDWLKAVPPVKDNDAIANCLDRIIGSQQKHGRLSVQARLLVKR
jgi:hypothetical protein